MADGYWERLTVQQLHTYYVLAGATPVLVHNTDGCPPISIYRTPKTADKDYELANGPNPEGVNDEGSNGKVYFGEKSVASEYQGRGTYAPGMIRYDMHPSFLEKFGDAAKRYDWQGPGGIPRIEFEIPYDRLDEFNEITLDRTWLPQGGGQAP